MINFTKYIFTQIKSANFIKHVRNTFSVRIFIALIQVITTILSARYLGASGRGAFSVAIAISTLGSYFSLLGLNAANTHFLAKKKTLAHSFFSNNILFTISTGISTSVIIFIILKILPNLYLFHSNFLLVLTCLWIPLNVFNILSQSLMLGLDDIKTFNKAELIAPTASICSLGLILSFKIATVELFFFCMLFGQLINSILVFHFLKPFVKSWEKNISFKELIKNLSYSLKVLYFPSIFILVFLNIDLLLIKHFLGSTSAGYYSIAIALINLILILPNSIGTLIFAKLSGIQEQDICWSYTKKIIKWIAPLILTLIFICAITAAPLINSLFGNSFAPAIPVFITLLPCILLYSLAIVYLNYFAVIGNWKINVFSTGMTVLLNLMLNLKLIPIYGILGAAYAATISYVSLLIILVIYIFSPSNPINSLKLCKTKSWPF